MPIRAVRVRGPFHGPSGYDHHVRAFVRQISRSGVAVQLLDFPFWNPRKLPKQMRDPWFDTLRTEVGARVFLQFCMPHQLVNQAGMINVNYTMFEATSVPKFWVKAQDNPLTIVPEESSRRAWLAAGMPGDLLRVCPLGIDPALFTAGQLPLPLRDADGALLSKRRVRFLNISEIVPRKNLTGLLRAWLLATGREDDAVLILKLGSPLPRDHAGVDGSMSQLELEHGKRFSEAAPVVFFPDLLADDEMPRLYATATHYISMSHGEGWDLPMMEAAASGLFLIAPDHSAYQTYLDPSVAALIPSRKVQPDVTGGLKVLFDGTMRWWEPDCDAAVDIIRDAIRGRDRAVASASDYVLGHWTWERATDRLLEVLSEAEGA